jgi:transcription elongation factor Elf1
MRTKYPLIRLGIGYTETVVSEVKTFECSRCADEFSIEVEYHTEGKKADIALLICPECFETILVDNPLLQAYFAVDLPPFSEVLH